jgi:N-hydroxyarylamine O-acetyltransferase
MRAILRDADSGITIDGMTSASFDLDAYLRRIQHAGPPTPTLTTLRAVAFAHPRAIPFENLNPLLQWPVRLDAESLQQKLIRDGRGGYCFEQNNLLKLALDGMGFRTTGLAARVMWEVPAGALRPRTHMLLRVDLESDTFIVDAGFGGQTLTAPLRLEADVAQETPHEPFRLVRDGDDFVLQAQIRGEWKSAYRFDLHPQRLPDYELANWYTAAHPQSRFVNALVASRTDDGRRYALFNNELAIHDRRGTERRTLGSTAELRAVLAGEIGLRLPDAPELEAVLAKAVAPA